MEAHELERRLSAVRLLALDVDGVLTDGALTYSSSGEESKRFYVADGLGLVLIGMAGIERAWISGRANPAVERRAEELGVRILRQGVRDKRAALAAIVAELGITQEQVAFMGDDLNDLPALELAGVKLAPANAVPEVRAVADIITWAGGGAGAVREVCDHLLTATGRRHAVVQAYLDALAEHGGPPAHAG